MARNSLCKKDTTTLPNGVIFTFANDKEVKVEASMFNEDMLTNFLKNGISQKLGDSYAGAADVEEAIESFMSTLEACKNGEWTLRGTGEGKPRVTQLAEALAAVTGKEIQACVDRIAEMDDAEKKALKDHAAIKAKLAEIQAQRFLEKAQKAQAEAANAPAVEF